MQQEEQLLTSKGHVVDFVPPRDVTPVVFDHFLPLDQPSLWCDRREKASF